ncbi:hypothetical protein L1987_71588 [Smallanthus sonchifolius]|uniref:Uncharacterized protein n=1 Tax=Smallanthus sonchifolius TaxID=185202 RepID=A0ACB9ATH3_9ASTR|nr:hypothetical protein L1987_71588 [Smallanthus sonchifolius]
MITFERAEEASTFLDNNKLWGKWFSDLEPWSGQSLAQERIVWLQIHGVSAHLWQAKVFDSIASEVGKIIAPSHASFNDGSLVLDTVGILVEDGWRLPDRIDWVPEWIGRPVCSQAVSRRAATATAPGNRSNSNSVEGEESPLHGNNACMGNSMNIDDSGGTKNVACIFKFAAGKRGEEVAQFDLGSPTIHDVAQKIGLKPRKRPRLGSTDNDPFNLDHIIGAVSLPRSLHQMSDGAVVGEEVEVGVPIPDLNASMGGREWPVG